MTAAARRDEWRHLLRRRGTVIQKRGGFHDTPEEMFKYLKIESQGIVKDETLWRFCEGSAASVDWLMERGVKFDSKIFWKKWDTGPRYYLYFSDNSLARHGPRLPGRRRAATAFMRPSCPTGAMASSSTTRCAKRRRGPVSG